MAHGPGQPLAKLAADGNWDKMRLYLEAISQDMKLAAEELHKKAEKHRRVRQTVFFANKLELAAAATEEQAKRFFELDYLTRVLDIKK